MSPYPYKKSKQVAAAYPNAFSPDIILCSSDHVDFCTFQAILARSSNVFAQVLILPASDWRDPTTGLQPAPKREDGVPVVLMPEDSKVLRSIVSTVSPGPIIMPDTLPETLDVLAAANKYGMGLALDAIRTLMPPIATLVNEHNAAATFKTALAGRLLDEALAAARALVRSPSCCAKMADFTDAEQHVFQRFRSDWIYQLVAVAKQMRDFKLNESTHDQYFRPRNGMQACISGLKSVEAQHARTFDSLDVPCWWYAYWQDVMCDLESGQLVPTAEALFTGLDAAGRAYICNEKCRYCCFSFGSSTVSTDLIEELLMKVRLDMGHPESATLHASSLATRS